MDLPSFLEPQLNVRVCRAAEESVLQPKFTFVLEDAKAGDFSLTKKCQHALRFCIDRDGCECTRRISKNSDDMWNLMAHVSRERFWTVDPPPTSTFFTPTFRIPECDFPLCFETLGLTMLYLTLGRSFLHIHSGTGFACTIAAFLLGASGVNHGVEFRPTQRATAKENLQRLLRLHPGLDTDGSLPLYHSRFPADLLRGSTKFDRILVTDCFRAIEDILSLKGLLNPNGLLVTGFAGSVYDETFVGMVVVSRRQPTNEKLRRTEYSIEYHSVAQGRLYEVILHHLNARSDTARRLAAARSHPVDQPSDSALPTLQALALRACSKRSNPIGPLHGDSIVVLRPPQLHRLPNLSVQLAHVTAAFHSLRAECQLSAEEPLGPSAQITALGELTGLAIALNGLGKQFLGQRKFALWKNGEAVQLSVPQGVMAWLLENIHHFARFCGVQNFEIVANDKDVFDETHAVAVMKPLLEAFVRFLRRSDPQVLEQRPPWNFQLSSLRQTRRTLTRLVACLWTDTSCLVRILRAMKKLCENANGGPLSTDPVISFNLHNCQWCLEFLTNKVLHQSDSFSCLEAVQDCFQMLSSHVRYIYNDACCLLEAAADVAEVQTLFCCFLLVHTSALRNLASSGRAQRASNAALPLRFVTDGGGLLDPALFQAERDFLVGNAAQQDSLPIADTCAFLVRRVVSDLKEALWLAASGEREHRRAVLEESGRAFHLAVLEPHLPMSCIDGLLRGTE